MFLVTYLNEVFLEVNSLKLGGLHNMLLKNVYIQYFLSFGFITWIQTANWSKNVDNDNSFVKPLHIVIIINYQDDKYAVVK